MKKLSLILLIITCCLPGFFASRLDAQVPNVTFTVQLSGEGARLGRVSLWQWLSGAPGPISLG